MDRKSDRRAARRYETVEAMWGTIGVTRELTLCNIGRGGVQVESPVPLPLNSAHTITLPFLRGAASVTARVRHATPIDGSGGARGYRIGLEFIAPSPAVVEQIDLLVATFLAGN